MADEVASLLVRITADGSQAVGVLNGVSATVGTLADKNATLMNKISATSALAGRVGTVMTKTIGVATVAGLTASAKAAGQLNSELANIGTLSVPTERLKEFKGQIQDIAIATGKGTSDISEGTYQVISAFGDAADTMEKVEINAKAAKAGLATTADSINLTSAVTKAYGDTSAAAVQKVADLAFKTVELGQTTFPELAQSIGAVTSLSKELGISQEELFATYATLTGVTGNAAEVQTQLKGVLNGLIKPSDKMSETIHGLGYESGYAMVNALGFAGTLDALQEATGNSSEKILELFNNNRAISGILPLVGSLYENYTQKLEKMENASGAATKAFEVQTEGVAKTGFTLEQAKVKMQVAAQRFGESAAPFIGEAAEVVDKASTSLANLNDEQRTSIINTGVLTTKVGVGLAVGGKAYNIATKLVGVAKAAAPLVATIGPAAAGIGLVTGALIVGKKAYDSYHEAQINWSEGMSETATAYSDSRRELTELNKLYEEYSRLQNTISTSNDKTQIDGAKARIEEIKDILSQQYNIDVDSTGIENALLRAINLRNTLSESSEIELENGMVRGKENYDNTKATVNDLEQQKAKAEEMRNAYLQADTAVQKMQKSYSDLTDTQRWDTSTQQQFISDWNEIADILGNDKMRANINGITADGRDLFAMLENGQAGMLGWKDKAAEQNKIISDLDAQIKEISPSMQEYIDSVKTLADGKIADIFSKSLVGQNTVSDLETLALAVKNADLSVTEYGQSAALAMVGLNSLDEAAEQNKLGDVARNYITAATKMGATATDAAKGAAMLKQGLTDMESVINAGALESVQKDMNELAHSLNLIPDSKHFEISADGDISLIDDATEKIEQISTKKGITVSVNAEGNIEILDEATGKVQELGDIGNVHIQTNADGNIEILDEAEEKIAQIDGDSGNITVNGAYEGAAEIEQAIKDKENTEDKKTNLSVNGEYSGKEDIAQALSDQENLQNKSVTYKVTYKQVGERPKEQAKGTQNFSGGLAMVNDDGTSDPRELIIDRGNAYIPNGRNVILPLSKGAKVYTSSQTQAIMRGLGIPRYAGGKDNSEGFITARDNWSHYTKTHAVTTTEELEHWLEMQKQYASNEKDIADIEEQVFSLRVKQMSEFNKNSENWLAHEEKYNNLTAEGYIEGLERMKISQKEYFNQGLISWDEYSQEVQSLNDRIADKHKEAEEKVKEENAEIFSSWQNDADMWERMRSTYGDWDKYGDSEEQFYKRKIDRIKEFYAQGIISFEDYDKAVKEASMDLYESQSNGIDEMLSAQYQTIQDLRQKFSDDEKALQDSWAVSDRRADMTDVKAQMGIYQNAVTTRGQEKYKELQEQLKSLQREEQLYNLQTKNNAIIKSLEEEYRYAEANKGVLLDNLRSSSIDISSWTRALNDNVSISTANIGNTLNDILKAINSKDFNVDVYNDNSNKNTINLSNGMPIMFSGGRYLYYGM